MMGAALDGRVLRGLNAFITSALHYWCDMESHWWTPGSWLGWRRGRHLYSKYVSDIAKIVANENSVPLRSSGRSRRSSRHEKFSEI